MTEPAMGGLEMEFWRIRVDEHELTSIGQTFEAMDHTIELMACTACGTPGCGHDFLAARSVGELVVWFPWSQEDGTPLHPLAEDCTIWFRRAQYVTACRAGESIPASSEASSSGPPRLEPEELEPLLRAQLRAWPEAIYVDGVEPPPHPLAPFLRELAESLCDKRADLVDAPDLEPTHEVVLGLDLKGCPEARLWLTSHGGRWHAAVVERPCFPVWLRTRALDKLLSGVALTRRVGPKAS